jgi:hypothetical protein
MIVFYKNAFLYLSTIIFLSIFQNTVFSIQKIIHFLSLDALIKKLNANLAKKIIMKKQIT